MAAKRTERAGILPAASAIDLGYVSVAETPGGRKPTAFAFATDNPFHGNQPAIRFGRRSETVSSAQIALFEQLIAAQLADVPKPEKPATRALSARQKRRTEQCPG